MAADHLVFHTLLASIGATNLLATSGFAVTAPLPCLVYVAADGTLAFPDPASVPRSTAVPHMQKLAVPLASAGVRVALDTADLRSPEATISSRHLVAVYPKRVFGPDDVSKLPGCVGVTDLCSGVPYTHRGLVFESKESAQYGIVELLDVAQWVSSAVPFVERDLDPWVVPAGTRAL